MKHLWCYNVVKKVWKKKKIVLKETGEAQDLAWDIECLVCDFQVKQCLCDDMNTVNSLFY